jgi:hypothetical protein
MVHQEVKHKQIAQSCKTCYNCFESIMRNQKPSNYDYLYDVLKYLRDCLIHLTKYRITTNKRPLFSLLSYQFISPFTNKNLLLNIEYGDVPHYVFTPKGIG